jgi:hypothetical protein
MKPIFGKTYKVTMRPVELLMMTMPCKEIKNGVMVTPLQEKGKLINGNVLEITFLSQAYHKTLKLNGYKVKAFNTETKESEISWLQEDLNKYLFDLHEINK